VFSLCDSTKYYIQISSKTQLRFSISQHKRDRALLDLILKYFNCGILINSRDNVEFTIVKLSDILDKIIPLFRVYTLQGSKALDFEDFCKIAELLNNKAHLTSEGWRKYQKN